MSENDVYFPMIQNNPAFAEYGITMPASAYRPLIDGITFACYRRAAIFVKDGALNMIIRDCDFFGNASGEGGWENATDNLHEAYANTGRWSGEVWMKTGQRDDKRRFRRK